MIDKKSWETKKLGDVCTTTSGGTPNRSNNSYYNGTIPWIKSGELDKGLILDSEEKITEEALKNSSAKVFPKGTLLIALYGATIGKLAFLGIDACTNQAICGIFKSDKIDSNFLYYFLFFKKPSLINKGIGGGQPNISQGIIKDLTIPIPALPIQHQIVSELDTLSEIITKKKQQLADLDKLAQATFYDLFGDLNINEKKWEIVPFNNIIEYIGDIGSNGSNANISLNLKMSDSEDYALMIRTLNFTANDFNKNVKYISKDAYDFFKKSQIFGGEIIFNKIGSAGINFIMPNLQRPVSLGLNQIMVRTKNINNIYLYGLLNSPYGKIEINNRVQGAVTKSITKGEMKKIPIHLPPLQLQDEYSKRIERIENQKELIKSSIDEVQHLFDYTMNMYFN